MLDDLEPAGFAARHMTSLSAITQAARDAWRADALTPGLRGDMVANPRLEGAIVADLVAARDDATADPVPAETLAQLDHLMSCDLQRLRRRAGLVWHAPGLLSPDAVRRLLQSCPSLDVGEVRFALGLRGHGTAGPLPEGDLETELEAAGRACMSAWLNRLPTPLPGLLSILEHPVGDAFRDLVDSAPRAGAFAACLQATEGAE